MGVVFLKNKTARAHHYLLKLSEADDIMTFFEDILRRLKENDPTLTRLDLSYNNIGDTEVYALVAALENNSTLTSLNLFYNDIGDDGAIALAAVLEKNSTLNNLNLFCNNIGAVGVAALTAALENNTSLTNLNLWYQKIRKVGTDELRTIVKILMWNRVSNSKSVKARIVAAFYTMRSLRPQLPSELLILVLEHVFDPRPGLRFIILETIREFEDRQRLTKLSRGQADEKITLCRRCGDRSLKRPRTVSWRSISEK